MKRLPATSASLNNPFGVWVDSSGNLYIADLLNHRIRRITPGADGLVPGATDEIITPVAGTGIQTGSIDGEGGVDPTDDLGDDGLATAASLNLPQDVLVDSGGNLIIVDKDNQRVRRVDATTGTISTVAGNGTISLSVTDGVAATITNLSTSQGPLDIRGTAHCVIMTWSIPR